MALAKNYYWSFNNNNDKPNKVVYNASTNFTTKKNTLKTQNNDYYGAWSQLPDIILEEIYLYLTRRERYYACQVCKNWYRAFTLPRVWSFFILDDTTLTRGKFNYYSGWQYVLDHMRTSTCFSKIGRHWKTLILEPKYNFQQLYQFMSMMSWFAERSNMSNYSIGDGHDAGVGANIRHLRFKFPCNMANPSDRGQVKIFGTGGEILEALKRLAHNFKNLKTIEFIDLMLESREALVFLDQICINCTENLRKLVLINATKLYCPLLHVGVFVNLNILAVSPQNLDDDVLELIGQSKLQHLHIVQNRYSPVTPDVAKLPRNESWIRVRKNNPKLKVHFEIEGNKSETKLPFEFPGHGSIPCCSIVLDNPVDQVSSAMLLAQIIIFYPKIEVYAIKGRARYYQHRDFSKRVDESLVQLCKTCPNIHTLMIRDKISTSTILEIVSTAKSLRHLYIRRNCVLKKCDKMWTKIASEWTMEHEKWIKENSNSYEKTEYQVSKILKYRWHMLSEKEFINQTINLHT